MMFCISLIWRHCTSTVRVPFCFVIWVKYNPWPLECSIFTFRETEISQTGILSRMYSASLPVSVGISPTTLQPCAGQAVMDGWMYWGTEHELESWIGQTLLTLVWHYTFLNLYLYFATKDVHTVKLWEPQCPPRLKPVQRPPSNHERVLASISSCHIRSCQELVRLRGATLCPFFSTILVQYNKKMMRILLDTFDPSFRLHFSTKPDHDVRNSPLKWKATPLHVSV